MISKPCRTEGLNREAQEDGGQVVPGRGRGMRHRVSSEADRSRLICEKIPHLPVYSGNRTSALARQAQHRRRSNNRVGWGGGEGVLAHSTKAGSKQRTEEAQ